MHEEEVAQALVNMSPFEARAAVNVLRQGTQAQCIAPVAITLGALAAGALVQKYVDWRLGPLAVGPAVAVGALGFSAGLSNMADGVDQATRTSLLLGTGMLIAGAAGYTILRPRAAPEEPLP
jgi:hypothetical protein